MILEAQNIKKSFYQGKQEIKIFDKLNLQLQTQESLAIVGPSGSGKSTLLSLLAGLESPDQGAILFNQRDIQKFTQHELSQWRREDLSIVFQQFHLFPHLTALENVLIPLELLNDPDAEDKAKAMLAKVSLDHRYKHFPSTLSGGECQRVAIARALVHQPQLILADEPSGNLDTETGHKVMDLFFDLIAENKTSVVLVTHNPALAKMCNKQLSLHS